MNVEAMPVPQPSKEELRAMPYADFLETAYWKQIARAVKERDGRRCVVCNSSKQLAAHHRTYAHHGEEHLFLGDLTTLCEACHTRHHFPPPPAREPVKPKKPIAPVVQFETRAQQKEATFYRKAARKLGINADELRGYGRVKVRELLDIRRGKKRKLKPWEKPPTAAQIVGDPDSVVNDMPPGDPIIITEEILDRCRANGAFTSATVFALGFNPKALKKGWASGLVDVPMPRAQLLKAMEGRHIYAKSTLKMRRNKNNDAITRLLDAAFPSVTK